MEVTKTPAHAPAVMADPSGYSLRPYQETTVAWLGEKLLAKTGAMVLYPPGLGKTAIVLHHLVRQGVRRTLYLAPLRVARLVPTQEKARWPELDALTVHVAEGTPAQRLEILARPADGPTVWTLPFHLADWLLGAINKGELKIPRFRVVICDESSKCFAAGTLVETDRGLVPIESVAPGDQVDAGFGLRRVTHNHKKQTRELVRVHFERGTHVDCTPRPLVRHRRRVGGSRKS